ncbi:MAG: tol-pal system protein YbgF [Pseudomonadota bacterium]
MRTIHMCRTATRFLLCLAAAAAVGLPAAAQTWTGSSSDPAELRYRLDLLDAELQDIRARLGGEASSSSAPSGGGGSIDTSRLEAELARLTGQVEEMQFELRQMREATERQLEDLSFRVTELEGGDTSLQSPIVLGETPTETPAPVILSEQADLDRAKLDIQQGRFDQGEERLLKFISDYPASALLGEAHYWLGQSQFVRGAFAEAATTYLAGYRKNPGDSYAPDNLLQLGITLGRLNQIEPACQTLSEVTRQFPNASSSVTQAATDEQASLGCV